MRDQAAEAGPARIFLIAEQGIEVADAVRKIGDRIDAGIAQILLGAQFRPISARAAARDSGVIMPSAACG